MDIIGAIITRKAREAGFKLCLSPDCQKLGINYPPAPDEAIHSEIKAHKEDVRCWLITEKVTREFEGILVDDPNATPSNNMGVVLVLNEKKGCGIRRKASFNSEDPPMFHDGYKLAGRGPNGLLLYRKHEHSRPIAPPTPSRGLLDKWMEAASALLNWKDEKGKIQAVPSEVEACIIGLRGFNAPKAQDTVVKLREIMPKARNALSRYKRHVERQRKALVK